MAATWWGRRGAEIAWGAGDREYEVVVGKVCEEFAFQPLGEQRRTIGPAARAENVIETMDFSKPP